MRIWILNHYALPRQASGPNAQAIIANCLQNAGHDVTLFPGSIGMGGTEQIVIPPGATYLDRFDNGVRYRYVKTHRYRSTLGRLRSMRGYKTSVLGAMGDLLPPDVVVGSCVHSWAVDAAMHISRRFGVPFVYHVRDIWPATLVDAGIISRRHPLHWILRRIECNAFRQASGVIGVMPGITEYAALHGVSPDRVSYVPNGVETTLYPPPEPPPGCPPFVVSYFGAHGPPNGLDVVLDAAAVLSKSPLAQDVVFRFVGDGADKPRLVKRATEMRLDNVEFRPRVSREELSHLASHSHMFVFAHPGYQVVRQYGLSCNKLFDYLLAARPIAFAGDSLNDPVSDAGAGLSVPARDPLALAEAIVKIRRMSSAEREEMGRCGRSYALEHHDLAKLAVTFERHLAGAIGRHCSQTITT